MSSLIRIAQRTWRLSLVRQIRRYRQQRRVRKQFLPRGVMPPKIYLSVSSEGYGHSSRAIALARYLHQEEVVIGAYSYALDRLEQLRLPCVAIPQEIEFVGAEGSFDVGRTILHNQGRALTFNQVIQHEMDLMMAHQVSLVVADGRIAPVLAAARLDLPCVVLTNQSAFYPFFAQDSGLVKLFGLSFDWMMNFWLSNAEEIFIPDFPPPVSVCLANLSEHRKVKKRTRFVGPLVPLRRSEVLEKLHGGRRQHRGGRRPRVVASLGGHQYRLPLFRTVCQLAHAMPDVDFLLLTRFAPESPLPANATLLSNVFDPVEYFAQADLVITQAGHSTAMELLTLGVPSVVVPDSNQVEQENNARKLVQLGVCRRVLYSDLTLDTLRRAVGEVLHNDSYRKQAEQLAAKAALIDGAYQTAEVLRDYASRLSAY